MPDALEVRDVAKAYGATRALKGVSMSVPEGSVHALLGGNGSGKSTLIKVLAGVCKADQGEIRVGDSTADARSQTPARAKEIGLHFVHQQDSTFGDLSVAENLAIGRGFETGGAGRVRWREQRRRAKEVLERFEIDAKPSEDMRCLSSAKRAMVAIARALQDQDESTARSILILDEPTASLPHHEVDQLLQALRRYAEKGQSILFVSHRIPEVISIASGATVLRDGLVAAHLEGEEVNHDRLVSLISDLPAVQVSDQKPAEVSSGGQNNGRSIGGEIVLETEGVCTGGNTVTVRAGEIVGLAGLLGSGRSALLRSLFGLAPGNQPFEFRLGGSVASVSSPAEAMRAGIAYVPEDRLEDAAFTPLSVKENLILPSLQGQNPLRPVRPSAEREKARRIAESFTVVASSGEAPFSSLSGGNQQKVVLGRWMSLEPRLLLLDEPTQGVDVGARAEIHRIVRAMADKGGAVLVTSSEFEELATLCDRVVVVANGRSVGEIDAKPLTDVDILNVVYEQERSAV